MLGHKHTHANRAGAARGKTNKRAERPDRTLWAAQGDTALLGRCTLGPTWRNGAVCATRKWVGCELAACGFVGHSQLVIGFLWVGWGGAGR